MKTLALVYKNRVLNIKRAINEDKENYVQVNYPDLSQYSTEDYEITQNHFSKWEVKDDGSVTVTYNIKEFDLQEKKKYLLSKLPFIRDKVVSGGIEIEINGETFHVMTFPEARVAIDQASLDAERRPNNWFKYWKFDNSVRMRVDSEQIEKIRSKVADHVEMCFMYESIKEDEILNATSREELNNVRIYSGWPLTVRNVGVNSQQNLEYLLEE